MREIIEKLMNGYKKARTETFAGNPFGTFVRSTIPQTLFDLDFIDKGKYVITGSVGQGNWAMIPWIGIFNTNITTSATKGVYIVYLLSKECDHLYLTFNQGCTELRNNHTKNETAKILREETKKIVEQIDSRGFSSDENISLGEKITDLGFLYQKGTIFYKEYRIENIPSDEELISDLRKMTEIYDDYINLCEDKWWPSDDEYSPGFTTLEWLNILNNPEIIGPVWGNVLAMYYTEKKGASPTQIGNKFGENPRSVTSKCTHLAQAIHKKTNCPIYEKDGHKKFWPILFIGRGVSSDEDGSYVWKLRPELY